MRCAKDNLNRAFVARIHQQRKTRGREKTASSERCDQERDAEAKSENLKKIPMPKELLNEQNSDLLTSSSYQYAFAAVMGPRRPDSIEGILKIPKSEGLIWSDSTDVL